MTEAVERLFDEYAAAHARGERPDVLAFLDRAGGERDELGRLIDSYLQAAPVQSPDGEMLALLRARLAEPEPALLVLRRKLSLKRGEVVGRLGELLGLPAAAGPRLARRYHELETNQLDPARVDDQVWSVLRGLFGQDVRSLVRPPSGQIPAAAFYRVADVAPAAPARLASRAEESEAFVVDRLFGV